MLRTDLPSTQQSPFTRRARLLGARRAAPMKYQRKDTGTRALEGRVACKLAADNYGCNEWWVLLEPESSA